LLDTKSDRYLEWVVKDVADSLDLIMKETRAIAISAHHTDD
jgi:hypothetical protein